MTGSLKRSGKGSAFPSTSNCGDRTRLDAAAFLLLGSCFIFNGLTALKGSTLASRRKALDQGLLKRNVR